MNSDDKDEDLPGTSSGTLGKLAAKVESSDDEFQSALDLCVLTGNIPHSLTNVSKDVDETDEGKLAANVDSPDEAFQSASATLFQHLTKDFAKDVEGYFRIADGIFMNIEKPLKEGLKIYEGYQEHVTGQRQPLAIKAILLVSKESMKEVQHLITLAPHPNIVQIIRSQKHTVPQPILYIAMELCSSQNLEEYLIEKRINNRPFDFEKTMSYAKGLVKGMEHIHRNQIAHGNLIPENILFSLAGDQIKISNFSNSQKLHQSESNANMTGSPSFDYDFIEQCTRTDIYSLAKILYSLFTNDMYGSWNALFGRDLPFTTWNALFGRDLPFINDIYGLWNAPFVRALHSLPEEMELVKKDQFWDLLAKMTGYFTSRLTTEEVSLHPFFTTTEGKLAAKVEGSGEEFQSALMPHINVPLQYSLANVSQVVEGKKRKWSDDYAQSDPLPEFTWFQTDFEKRRAKNETGQDSGTESSAGSCWGPEQAFEIIEAKPAASLRHRKRLKRRHKKPRNFLAGSSSTSGFGKARRRSLEGETTNTEHWATQTSTSSDDVEFTFEDLDVGTKPVETTTSTKDSSTQTRTFMENAATQTDEVVTTFGNLDGGLAISKSIHKVIGSDPEQLNVGGCLADFPPHSFSESTPVNVTAELNTSKRSKKFILFTPSLFVDANGLRAKIRVRLPSWCVNNGQQKVEARILHLPKDADDWEDTGTTLPVTSRPFFEFYWQDFCAIAVGDNKDSPNLQQISRRIAGNVYVSDANEVSIVFHKNDKEKLTSESLVAEVVKARMTSATPPKNWKIRLNQFTAKHGDIVEAHVKCRDPAELMFVPEDPFTFEVDKNFDEEPFVEHHGVVLGSLEEKRLICMQCTVHKAYGEDRKKISGPSLFTCNWMPTNLGEEQKQSKKVPRVKVNVNVNADQSKHTETENIDNRGQKVIANKYVGPKAHVQYSESNTSATVTSSGVPANQN